VRRLCAIAFALFCATASAAAQSNPPTGYVSLFADHLPNRDATELRVRIFAEDTLDAGSRVRFGIAGFVEGLAADRRGTVTDAIAEPQDLMATIRTKRLDFSAGLGRVVWGRLDELQPTDVVNPIDVSRFFFEGRGEARLSVPLLRGVLYTGEKASIEGVYVPFFRRGRFDRLAEESSPFSLAPAVPLTERPPARTAGNAQGGARASFTAGRLDWSLSAYDGFRPFGVYTAAGPLSIEHVYPRFTMAGADFETVAGAWVVRGELAAFLRDAFQAAGVPAMRTGRSFDGGGGVDRKAGDYRISAQFLVHREQYDDGGVPRTDVSLIVSADRSFARQKYETRLFGVCNPASGAAFIRGIGRANVRDNLAVEASAGWFGGTGLDTIGRFSDSDFAYLRLKYFF
jgi:hypothetical protein